MSAEHTPFRSDFPAAAMLDALSVIKDGAANSPAGRLQLAHSAYDLVGWALHVTLEGSDKGHFFADRPGPLTDEEAMALLDTSEVPPGLMAMPCPISPATALKLAAWLLKAAEIVIPILL
jgi:hypothetical protein